MVNAIKQAGGNPQYTEYPNVGHGVWDYTYNDPKFWQWMFSQKRK
jgi:predicted peptidase